MYRRRLIHFGLIGLFVIAAAALGIESWRTLSMIRADLPTLTVKLHRAVATQFEALTRLASQVDRLDRERNAFRLNDVSLALNRVLAIDRQFGGAFETLGSKRIEVARQRLAPLRGQVGAWVEAGGPQGEEEVAEVKAELVTIIAAFEAAIAGLNRSAVSSLELQRDHLGAFQLWVWVALSLVCLSAGGIAFALLWQSRTADRLNDALQSIELDLSQALGAIHDGFALYGADGGLRFCNANYRELIGETRDADLVGRDYEGILRSAVARRHYPEARDDPEGWIARQCRAFQREHSEAEIEIQGERWYLAQSTRSPDGGTVHVLAEVSELKRRENSLRRIDARLEEAQTMARIGNWEFDMTSRELWWSNELYRIFGVDREAEPLVEGSFTGFVEEDERAQVQHALYEAMERRSPVNLECGVVLRDGQHKQVELHARVESEPKTGQLIFKGTVQDITAKQEAIESLKRTEAFLRAITDHLPAQIAYIDAEQRFRFINRAGARWFARPPQEIVGRELSELVGDEEYQVRKPYIEAALQGRTVDARGTFGYPDGITRELDITYVPDIDDDGALRGYCALLVDITEDLEREDLLRRAQKMEAIGQLTGGIAHDFNNILGVIVGNLQLLARQLDDEKALARAKSAERAAFRGAELTSRLLAFSRRQVLEPRIIEVNKLVQGMDDMLRRTLGEAIEIETVLGAGLWLTKTDPGQLENALLNMAVNARDAMPEGGKLTIETANTRLDNAYVRGHPYVEAGQYVMLAVTDTGTGIPKEVLDRVFEPFFTTKEQGKGTGLGLSMIYGFAKQSGGHVNIYSEVGAGTTVRVYLPRAMEATAADDAVRASEEEAFPRGTETILIVEDDRALRETAMELLTDLGYSVLEAENGQQALALLEREAQIDLVLTDFVMPGGMNGLEVARQARQIRPELKVILTSGYAANGAVHRGIAEQDAHWISKPYDLASLAQKVREALDA